MNSRRMRDVVLLATAVIQAVLTVVLLRRWYGEQYFDAATADCGLHQLALDWLVNGFGLLLLYARRTGRSEWLGITPIAPKNRQRWAALNFFALSTIAFLGLSAPFSWRELRSYAWYTECTRVPFNVAWTISLMVLVISVHVVQQAWKPTHLAETF